MIVYRGYEITNRSVAGGKNISKDDKFVDFVIGGYTEARHLVDEIIKEEGEVS